MHEFAAKSCDAIVVFHPFFTITIHLPWMLPMQTSNVDAQVLVIEWIINGIPFKKNGTHVIRQKKTSKLNKQSTKRDEQAKINPIFLHNVSQHSVKIQKIE